MGFDSSNLGSGEVPDFGGTPEQRAALQEAYAQMAQQRAEQPGYVPQSYMQQQQPNNLAETPPGAVDGNLPVIGWTCQANPNQPVFPPYNPTKVTPAWTTDPNSIAGGRYDQNQTITAFPPNRINAAPIGGAVIEVSDYPVTDATGQDEGTLPGFSEW